MVLMERLNQAGRKIDSLFGTSEKGKAARFVLGLAVVFVVLDLLVSLVPLELIELATAQTALFSLGFAGKAGTMMVQEPVLIFLEGYTIQISYLCTGLLEMLVLVAAITASFDVGRRKRLYGVVAAVPAIFAFNQFRIFSTIMSILTFGVEDAELTHDLFFRVFLLVVIAGFYGVWYFWACGRGPFSPQARDKNR